MKQGKNLHISKRTLALFFVSLSIFYVASLLLVFVYTHGKYAPVQSEDYSVVVSDAPNAQVSNEQQSLIEKIVSAVFSTDEAAESIEKIQLNSLQQTMGWIYPGDPACNALIDAQKFSIDVLKPEYFLVTTGGEFVFMQEDEYGCNAYSSSNVQLVRDSSKEQYVTVSSSYAQDMDAFLRVDEQENTYTETLVQFVIDEQFEGVEIDFEDFGGWNQDVYDRYKKFLTRLGEALHKKGKKLMVDVPPTTDAIQEQWYVLRLKDFNSLPVDQLVVMAYDYQFDQGAGQPVAPLEWIRDVIRFTGTRYAHIDRLVIGVPTYGYQAGGPTRGINILTYQQISQLPGFSSAIRDADSGEMMWTSGRTHYVFQDIESVSQKVNIILEEGVGAVSFWHLGGNPWYK